MSASSGLAGRLLVTAIIVLVVALIYALLGLGGLVPVPRSIASLAARHGAGRGVAVVWGYYVAQPFISYGGPQLPPYVFAADVASGAPALHVTPTLADLRAGRVVARIDTATGDGTSYAPYAIHTIASAQSADGALVVGAVVVLVLAFAIAGPLSDRLARRST